MKHLSIILVITFGIHLNAQTTMNLNLNDYLDLESGTSQSSQSASSDLFFIPGDASFFVTYRMSATANIAFIEDNDSEYDDINSATLSSATLCTSNTDSHPECNMFLDTGYPGSENVTAIILTGEGNYYKLKINYYDSMSQTISVTYTTLPQVFIVSSSSNSGTGTLRDAISLASNNESIQIDVAEINLTSSLAISKSLNIYSNTSCIIKGDKTFQLINDSSTSNTLEFKNLTFNGGYAGAYGGAIGGNNVNLTLTNCTVENSEVNAYGGGIAIRGVSVLNLNNSKVDNNTAVGYGGGIAVMDGGSVNMDNAIISNNISHYGSGIQLFGSANLNAVNTTFFNNMNNLGNTTSYKGKAILAWDSSNVTLENVTVYGHTIGGSSIEVDDGTLTIKSSVINNSISNLSIRNGGSPTLISQNNNFSNDGSMSSVFDESNDLNNGILSGDSQIYLGSQSGAAFGGSYADLTNSPLAINNSGTGGIQSTGSGNAAVSGNLASGTLSAAFGNQTRATSAGALAIGQWNTFQSSIDGAAADATHQAFVIGNGSGSGRSNAFEVLYDGTTTIAGDVVVNSDMRLKANIISLGSTLVKLLQIDGKTYTMKRDKEKKQKIGVLAQDIEKVFPELVSVGSDGILSVNYQGLVPVLINSINEQQNQFVKQQAEIDALKALVKKLINKK
ncbi:tail fiber domain-containing protein [Polaribacter sp.]|nr:tail fiber domain-containing protein [Polaribacter sp.]